MTNTRLNSRAITEELLTRGATDCEPSVSPCVGDHGQYTRELEHVAEWLRECGADLMDLLIQELRRKGFWDYQSDILIHFQKSSMDHRLSAESDDRGVPAELHQEVIRWQEGVRQVFSEVLAETIPLTEVSLLVVVRGLGSLRLEILYLLANVPAPWEASNTPSIKALARLEGAVSGRLIKSL